MVRWRFCLLGLGIWIEFNLKLVVIFSINLGHFFITAEGAEDTEREERAIASPEMNAIWHYLDLDLYDVKFCRGGFTNNG